MPFELDSNEVHVWYCPLPTQANALDESALSQDELDRAGRCINAAKRAAFVGSRLFLRGILAGYVGISPAQLQFGCESEGKPYLTRQNGLHFNLSHAQEQVALALSPRPHLGVDLERIEHRPRLLEIAERFFTTREFAAIRSAPDDEKRLHEFFRIWTCKEAVLKATGHGLGRYLKAFSALPEGLVLEAEMPETDWFVDVLDGPRGYASALAIAGHKGAKPCVRRMALGSFPSLPF